MLVFGSCLRPPFMVFFFFVACRYMFSIIFLSIKSSLRLLFLGICKGTKKCARSSELLPSTWCRDGLNPSIPAIANVGTGRGCPSTAITILSDKSYAARGFSMSFADAAIILACKPIYLLFAPQRPNLPQIWSMTRTIHEPHMQITGSTSTSLAILRPPKYSAA